MANKEKKNKVGPFGFVGMIIGIIAAQYYCMEAGDMSIVGSAVLTGVAVAVMGGLGGMIDGARKK